MTSSLIDRLNAVSEQVALKRPVRVASTVNLTLSAFQTIDGVTPAASDENLRVLVKNQMTSSENGIYLMTTGSWERTDDFDGNRDVVKGTRVPVTEGNIGANKTYVVTAADPIIIDESGITFSEITESLVTSEFAKPRAPVSTLSSDTILTALDAGKQIDVDCTSADRVITLPAVSDPDLRNGDRITIRYAAGTNQITIACQGSDGINGASSLALTSRYESLTLAANDSNWAVIGHARPFAAGSVVFIRAVSRTLLTPPVSPVPGARYIIAANGVPMGDWSSYANNDVIEANGQGGWIRYSPSESWHAYVEAENKVAFFTGTAWQGLPNTDDPAESDLGYAFFQHQEADGTDAGASVASSWTARKLATEIANSIAGCSLASNTITLPAGKYLIIANGSFHATGDTQLRFKSTTTSTVIYSPQNRLIAAGQADVMHLVGVLNLSAQEAFKLEYWCGNPAGSTSDLGRAIAGSASTIGATAFEFYAGVQILDLASLQGGKGDPGDIGPQGFSGFKYQYSTATTESEPATGFLRLSDTDFSFFSTLGAGFAYIDGQSAETGNPDVSDEIAAWGTSGGILKIAKVGSEQNWVTYDVQLAGVTDNGGWLKLTLHYRDHAGSLTNADTISVQFSAKGTTGAAGTSFPVFDYTLDLSTVDAVPSVGHLRLHTGNTFINIHETDLLVVDRAADIAAWDDDGGPLNRGYLYIVNAATAARIGVFKITGSNNDLGSYVRLNVTAISYAAPGADTRVALMFAPAGATGTIGGTLGLVDSVIPKSSGVGGATLQPSSITESSAGKLSVNYISTASATVSSALKVSNLPSVVSTTGVGVGIEFETKNGSSTPFLAASIVAEAKSVVNSSEKADLVFKTVSGAAAPIERMRLRDFGNLELGSSSAFALKGNGQQTLTGGFAVTPFSIGTISGSTVTPNGANGQLQYLTNNGAFQINPPPADTAVDILVTNTASNGTITFSSGFTVGTSVGDTLPTANGKSGIISIQRINGLSTYSLRSLSTST